MILSLLVFIQKYVELMILILRLAKTKRLSVMCYFFINFLLIG